MGSRKTSDVTPQAAGRLGSTLRERRRCSRGERRLSGSGTPAVPVESASTSPSSRRRASPLRGRRRAAEARVGEARPGARRRATRDVLRAPEAGSAPGRGRCAGQERDPRDLSPPGSRRTRTRVSAGRAAAASGRRAAARRASPPPRSRAARAAARGRPRGRRTRRRRSCRRERASGAAARTAAPPRRCRRGCTPDPRAPRLGDQRADGARETGGVDDRPERAEQPAERLQQPPRPVLRRPRRDHAARGRPAAARR